MTRYRFLILLTFLMVAALLTAACGGANQSTGDELTTVEDSSEHTEDDEHAEDDEHTDGDEHNEAEMENMSTSNRRMNMPVYQTLS